MNANQAKYPQLRFKGFTDPWEQRKFKDILKTHSFRSYLAGVSENGEYEVIQQGDKPIVGYSDGEPFTDYKDVTLFGDHTVSLYKPKSPFFVATDGVKILSADNFEGDYLYTTLEHYKPEPQGYKRHFTILKNQDVWFTENMEEQQKIGVFFKQLDDTITLHQRKLAKLKELKQGYLQKLFPKNGSKFPQLRFAGFADAWEQRKLIDLLNQPITDGPHETPNLVEKGIPFISADAIVDNRIDFSRKRGFITEEYDLQCRKKYGPELYDVYLVKSGSTVGKVAIVETTKQFNIWSPLAAMRCKGKTNPYFLYFLFQTKENQNQVKSKASNGTQPNLSMRELEQFNVQISPLHDEQQKIGAFFKQLDSLITLHQRKLEKLQELKKGYLQKMFV